MIDKHQKMSKQKLFSHQGCIQYFIFWDHKANENIFFTQTLGILRFYLNLIITKQDSVYSTHHFIRFEIKIGVFQRGCGINILYILI
jgi:hypothetical protein